MRVAVQSMPIICTIIISIIEIIAYAKRVYGNKCRYNMKNGKVIGKKELKKMESTDPKPYNAIMGIGKVIGEKEWKEIETDDPDLYNGIWNSDIYQGHCYHFSRELAMHLQNAEVWYLSIKDNGEYISHAVIFKDGYIFDTNARMNIPKKEYMALNKAIIYKKFSKKEYEKKDFFDSIREDLIAYCRENNVYCNPE